MGALPRQFPGDGRVWGFVEPVWTQLINSSSRGTDMHLQYTTVSNEWLEIVQQHSRTSDEPHNSSVALVVFYVLTFSMQHMFPCLRFFFIMTIVSSCGDM